MTATFDELEQRVRDLEAGRSGPAQLIPNHEKRLDALELALQVHQVAYKVEPRPKSRFGEADTIAQRMVRERLQAKRLELIERMLDDELAAPRATVIGNTVEDPAVCYGCGLTSNQEPTVRSRGCVVPRCADCYRNFQLEQERG